jgi:hypothetical protein
MPITFSKSGGYTTPSTFIVSPPSAPTPLFNSISGTASGSARGVYSLFAITGTSVKVIQLSQGPSYPTAPNFTSGGTQTNNQYSQSLAGSISLLTGTYVANCSSWATTDGTSQAWKAFDGDTTTFWENNYYVQIGYDTGGTYTGSYSTTVSGSPVNGEWLQLKFPTQVALRSYSMYARSGFASRMPAQFTVAGSNDGLTWTTVDTKTGITTWTGQTPISFTPSVQTTPWTYFRLIAQALVSGPNDINVGQWTLSVTPYSDFYADTRGNLTTGINGTGQSVSAWLAGTTGYVTTWYDQSGGSNNAVQSNVTFQPTLTLAANNFINFNIGTSSNAFFSITNQVFPPGNSPFTTIARLGPCNGTTYQVFWHFGTPSSGSCVGLVSRPDFTPMRYSMYFFNGFDVSASGVGYVANTIISTDSTGTAQKVWQDGTQIGTGTYSGLNVVSGNQFIGAQAGATSNAGPQIRDLYIFSTSLSGTDRNTLENGYTTSGINSVISFRM